MQALTLATTQAAIKVTKTVVKVTKEAAEGIARRNAAGKAVPKADRPHLKQPNSTNQH